MRSPIRKPSISKRISARTSVARYVRHSLGLKAPRGAGWLTNPTKAAYNRVYNRTSVDLTGSGSRGASTGTGGAVGVMLALAGLCLLAVPVGLIALVIYIIASPAPKQETSDQMSARMAQDERNIASQPSTATVTAEKLGVEYSLTGGDTTAADQKYDGKVITVEGRVECVVTDASPTVCLKSSNRVIKCWLCSENSGTLESLKSGQVIAIKGKCEGLGGGSVVVDACTLAH